MSNLQFSPDILKRLGEELVPHADQGLLELAKNAYDADATECLIQLENVDASGGRITISDNGLGMSWSAIENGWLVLGKSRKAGDLTKKYKRVPAGDKGLGRLAALRLGRKAILRTRPDDEPGVEYSVTLDWDNYDQALFVEEVPTPIKKKKTKKKPGTEIELQSLIKPLSSTDVHRLSRSLVLLSDPFGDEQGFRTSLSAPEFDKFENLVKNAYFDFASYRLSAKLLPDGTAVFQAYDDRKNLLWHEEIEKRYRAPEADFDLWAFILNAATFSTRDATVGEVRDWLNVTGGVHIYENGIRVAPYGGADADWLKLNEMRVASPEERPSTNTSIGRVSIKNQDGRLVQKTDRNGYIEDEAFVELRAFGQDALNWLARHRLKDAETRRLKEKANAQQAKQVQMRSLNTVLENLSTDNASKKRVKNAARKVAEATNRENVALKNDLQLYRSLATAGISSAVFAHQITHPIRNLEDLLSLIENKLPPDLVKSLDTPLSHIQNAKEKLLAYAKLPLRLLKAEKRRIGAIEFTKTLKSLLDQYKPILSHANISLELNLPRGAIKVMGSAALIEGVYTNFLSNSIKAFERARNAPKDRVIRIEGSVEDKILTVIFVDSGPGIVGISPEEVWLPGRTTDESDRGTGFGLTIVRDSIKDLNGEVSVGNTSELGGAKFIVRLPIV